MCDRRELDKIREQRDDAIGRAVDAAGQLADLTTERDALAEIVADLTEELAEATARLQGVLAYRTADGRNWHPADVTIIRAAAEGSE